MSDSCLQTVGILFAEHLHSSSAGISINGTCALLIIAKVLPCELHYLSPLLIVEIVLCTFVVFETVPIFVEESRSTHAN